MSCVLAILWSALLMVTGCAEGEEGEGWEGDDYEGEWVDTGSDGSSSSGGSSSGSAGDGESLYLSTCSGCHGSDGRGSSAGPNIRGEVGEMSDGELRRLIQNGEGDMPGFPSVSDDDAYAIIDWMREAF